MYLLCWLYSRGETRHNEILTIKLYFILTPQKTNNSKKSKAKQNKTKNITKQKPNNKKKTTIQTIGILTKVFCISGPNLVIIAWTGDELSREQTLSLILCKLELKA